MSSLTSGTSDWKRDSSRDRLEWERYREEITRHYIDWGRPLREIIALLKRKYGFVATEKQFKYQLKRWSLRKYYTKSEALAILQVCHRRQAQGKESIFRFRDGREIREHDVKRYLRRSKESLEHLERRTGELPEYIRVSTPEVTSPPLDRADTHSWAGPHFAGRASHLEHLSSHGAGSGSDNHVDSTRGKFIDPKANQIGIWDPRQVEDWSTLGLQAGAHGEDQPPRPLAARMPSLSRPLIAPAIDLITLAVLPALLVSEYLRGETPGTWMVGIAPQYRGSRPDLDILRKCVDVLAWIQASREVTQLAVAMLLRVLLAQPSDDVFSLWSLVIVAFRFAQIFLEDGPLEAKYWQQAATMLQEPQHELIRAEVLILTMNLPLFRDLASKRKWQQLTVRLEFVAASCLQHLEYFLAAPRPAPEASSLWSQHKAEICQLYRSHSLHAVASLMKDRYGFSPSIRAYRQRIAEWGIKKRLGAKPCTLEPVTRSM